VENIDIRQKQKFRKRKKIVISVFVFWVTYITIYLLLSLFGEYVPGTTGKYRYVTSGLGVTDVQRWQPKFIYAGFYQPVDGTKFVYTSNALGYFYAPLVIIDQKYFHKTQEIIPPSVKESIESCEGK
jgi:hypothetical protein